MILCLTVYRYLVRRKEVVDDADERDTTDGGAEDTDPSAQDNLETPSGYGRA
ncbi:hypothetical protein ACRS6B_05630 [Nocardia asteroides]